MSEASKHEICVLLHLLGERCFHKSIISAKFNEEGTDSLGEYVLVQVKIFAPPVGSE